MAILDNGYIRKEGLEYRYDTKSFVTKKGKLMEKDAFQASRIYGIEEARKALKEVITKEQIIVGNELPLVATIAAKYPAEYKAVKWFVDNIYRTVNNIEKEDKARCNKIKNEFVRSESLKVIKAEAGKGYQAITNFCRLITPDLSPEERAAILLSIAYKGKAVGADINSSTHVVAGLELLHYDLTFFSNVKATKDKLISCSFEDGDTAEFICGYADSEDGSKSAVAKENLDGTFTIEIDENGRAWAVREIAEQISLPPVNKKQLIFKVYIEGLRKGNSNGINQMINMLVNKEVTLIPYIRKDGKSMYDLVVVGDIIVGEFQRPQGNKKGDLIENAYRFKKGRVTSANIGSVEYMDRNGRTRKGMCAYVIMDDCVTVPEEEVLNLDLHKVEIEKSTADVDAAHAVDGTGKRIRRKTGIGSATKEEVVGDKPATDSEEVNSKKKRVRCKTGVVDSISEEEAPKKKKRIKTGIVDSI